MVGQGRKMKNSRKKSMSKRLDRNRKYQKKKKMKARRNRERGRLRWGNQEKSQIGRNNIQNIRLKEQSTKV